VTRHRFPRTHVRRFGDNRCVVSTALGVLWLAVFARRTYQLQVKKCCGLLLTPFLPSLLTYPVLTYLPILTSKYFLLV